MPKNRQQKKADTRQRILDTSFTLFFRKGYNDTSYSDIAKQAKVGYGTVYSHFDSKEEILLELSINELTSRTARVEEIQSGSPSIEKILKIVNFHWDRDMSLPRKVLETFHAHRWQTNLKTHKKIRAIIGSYISSVTETLDRAKANGLIAPNVDTLMATQLLNTAYVGALQNGRFNTEMQSEAKANFDKQVRYLLGLPEE